MDKMLAATLRAEILAKEDLPVSQVYVPEWDLTVPVRAMSAAIWQEAVIAMNKAPEKYKRATIVSYGVVDEENNLVFGLEDVPLLAEKHAQAIVRLSDEIFRLNRGGKADIDEASENLAQPQAGASPSD